jgi:hypothetical protein
MSALTSPSLPRSDPSFASADLRFDDLFSLEGAEELWASWRDGLTPDPTLTVSEWADRHRILSPRASAEPGRYRTDRTPYMRAIMDALSPANAARRVVFMKAAQVGAPLALDTPVPTAAGWKTMGARWSRAMPSSTSKVGSVTSPASRR